MSEKIIARRLTVYARTLKHLTGFAGRAQAITFDLFNHYSPAEHKHFRRSITLRFRQLLQFILSLGSLLNLLAAADTGSLSMPTCGLWLDLSMCAALREVLRGIRRGLRHWEFGRETDGIAVRGEEERNFSGGL